LKYTRVTDTRMPKMCSNSIQQRAVDAIYEFSYLLILLIASDAHQLSYRRDGTVQTRTVSLTRCAQYQTLC
jgi:hypothetical protein